MQSFFISLFVFGRNMYTMPRCRDSIVNGRHLANERQTKKDARKFALAKTLLTLERQTGESTEEYAVAKALLNLSVEPTTSSGEQIK